MCVGQDILDVFIHAMSYIIPEIQIHIVVNDTLWAIVYCANGWLWFIVERSLWWNWFIVKLVIVEMVPCWNCYFWELVLLFHLIIAIV